MHSSVPSQTCSISTELVCMSETEISKLKEQRVQRWQSKSKNHLQRDYILGNYPIGRNDAAQLSALQILAEIRFVRRPESCALNGWPLKSLEMNLQMKSLK